MTTALTILASAAAFVLMAIMVYMNIRFGGGKTTLKSDPAVDIDKYKEEDVSNISKEETPIIKELEKRQSKSYLIGLGLFAIAITCALLGDYISKYVMAPIVICTVIGMIFAIIYNIRISRTKERIKRWQLEQLYSRYKKDLRG